MFGTYYGKWREAETKLAAMSVEIRELEHKVEETRLAGAYCLSALEEIQQALEGQHFDVGVLQTVVRILEMHGFAVAPPSDGRSTQHGAEG